MRGAGRKWAVSGDPADKGGVKGGSKAVNLNEVTLYAGGDILIVKDGQPVRQFNNLVAYLVTQAAPGQEVTLTVNRDGKEVDLQVILGEHPIRAPHPQRQTGMISPRAAINIARDYVNSEGLLKGRIAETVVTQDATGTGPCGSSSWATARRRPPWWSTPKAATYWIAKYSNATAIWQ